MQKAEKNPSDRLLEFLDFLEEAKNQYEDAKKKCEEYDSTDRLIYWAHKFEIAKDKSERNKLATAYQNERRERRKYKDICDTYVTIYNFVSSDNNKPILKRLKGIVPIQKKKEEYLRSEREYKAGEKYDSD